MRKKELQKRKERKTSKAEKGKSYLLEDQDAIAAGTMYGVCVCCACSHVHVHVCTYICVDIYMQSLGLSDIGIIKSRLIIAKLSR